MQSDITVIGGGIVAAAVSLAAAQCNLRVQRLLAAAPSAAAGRRYALSRRSVAFLQRLGVEIKMLPVPRFILHAGKTCLQLADHRAPLCYMAAEGDLMQALHARCQAAAISNTLCREVLYERTSPAALHLGVDGAAHSTALLAAADGARSLWAQQLGLYSSSAEFHQQAVVADVIVPQLAPDEAVQWFDDNDIVALLPAGDGVFSLVWSTAAPPAEKDLAEALARRIGIQTLSLCAGSMRCFALRASSRCARVAPRTALLGDAAGIIHPLAGQGLNLGLADAETLIQCVHRRLRGDLALGLAAYSRARTRRHNQLQSITKFLLPHRRRTAALLAFAHLPGLRRLAILFANA